LPRLAELAKTISYDSLLRDLPNTPLPSAEELARNQNPVNLEPNFAQANQAEGSQSQPNDSAKLTGNPYSLSELEQNPYQFLQGNRANEPANPPAKSTDQQVQQAASAQKNQSANYQNSKESDFQQRSRRYQAAAQQSLMNATQREAAQEPLKEESKVTP